MADVTGKEYLVEKQWKQADGVQNTCSYTISTFPHICIFTKDFDNELDQLISKYIEKHTSHGRST